MTKVTITAGHKGLAHDEFEVKVLLRGTPEAVIFALAHGLPREALQAIHEALGEEMRRRKPSRAVDRQRRPVNVSPSRRRSTLDVIATTGGKATVEK